MSDKIGVGVIGGGGISAEGHICGYQADPRCEVVALYDVDAAKMGEQAQRLGVPHTYTDLEAFLQRDDIQAVSICSPDHLHGLHGHAALQAGKHVLCEKPMTTSREDAARLVQDVRSTGLVFLGGHVYHFRPDYQAMAAELRAAGIRAEVYLGNPKNFGNQLKYADKRNAPVAIIQGGDEAARGVVQVKDLILGAKIAAEASHEEWKAQPAQTEVARADIVAEVRRILG